MPEQGKPKQTQPGRETDPKRMKDADKESKERRQESDKDRDRGGERRSGNR